MKKIWKLCAFLPALFMMGVIFSFSAQTGTQSGSLSHDISVRVVETKGRFFHQELEKKEIEKQADEIEFYIRKAAHMTEYAVLTLLVAFGFYVNGFRRKRWLMVGFIFCVLYAATDEFHQSFVGGRGQMYYLQQAGFYAYVRYLQELQYQLHQSSGFQESRCKLLLYFPELHSQLLPD